MRPIAEESSLSSFIALKVGGMPPTGRKDKALDGKALETAAGGFEFSLTGKRWEKGIPGHQIYIDDFDY